MKGSLLFLALSAGCALAQSLVVPVLKSQIPNFNESVATESRTIDLTTYFGTEEILDEAARLTATYDLDGTIITSNFDFLLFKNLAPVTVENLLGYVDRGDYTNMMIHRTASNFVIQGGGFTVLEDENGRTFFENVPTQDPIVNEFNVSNTLGTLSMAKLGGNPDSATSQWFVNTAANSDNLDEQNGGFTVFGRISKSTLPNAVTVNSPDKFLAANFGGATTAVPLEIASTPTTLNIDDFFRFDSATRVPTPAGEAGTSTELTYRILSETGSDSISAVLSGSDFNLSYADPVSGDFKIFLIETEDSVGNLVQDTFMVSMTTGESYQAWRAANFSGGDPANDAISGPEADPNNDGVTNLQHFAHGLPLSGASDSIVTFTENLQFNSISLSFPVAPNLAGVRFIPERSHDLITWNLVPASSSVVSNITTFTIAQNSGNFSKTFYRVRVSLD